MRLLSSRVLLSLIFLTTASTTLAVGSAEAATEPAPVPSIDIDGADYFQPDTDFGVDWRISYPDGVSDVGWSTFCSLDGQAEEQCTSESVNAMTLSEGRHVLRLTPRNPDGGQDGETYAWKLVVDVSAPVPIALDKTPLVRMGQDISLPVLFEDPQTHFEWSCYDFGPNTADIAAGTYQGIVIPSPESDLTVRGNYDCRAINDRDLTGYLEDLQPVWDAEKPEAYLPTGIPRLMTHPVGFRMKAYDDGTSAADEPMRIFAQRRVLTPSMTWRRWRTPDRWVTTRKAPEQGDWSRGFRLRVPRGYSVCVRPGARDAVGRRNVVGHACTTRAWDDRDVRRTKGWTEISPRGSYQGTALRTRRYGARLKLTRPAQGRAAAILVRKCPSCGRIQVIGPDNPYWGVPNLEYSLRARRAHWARVSVSWLNHRYHGDYTIKVVSSGRPVVIDGIAVSPWPIRHATDWRRRQYQH